MLIYHPAYDAYHCVYRLIFITNTLRELEYAKLRILDFYLCFPAEIGNVELPQAQQKIRTVARRMKNKFRGPISVTRTFRDLEPIQQSAARLLTASGVFSAEKLEEGTVSRTDWEAPSDFQKVSYTDSVNSELVNYIVNNLSTLPLGGLDGLKRRTGLMEFRYDPI